jgi:RNA polymerase sigma-70 factor (ECF subfamily)
MTLLLRLRARSDQLSWNEFHERYGEILFRYARGRGASLVDAEDVVQEVEMAVFKAMEGFEYDARKGRFRAYLRSAVVHALARRNSKEARQGPAVDPNTLDYLVAAEESSADARWEKEWRQHRLRWALRSIADELDEATMRAFELHAMNGISVEQTAEQLNLSKASVYQAKSRILKRVRERLQELDPDEDV